MVAANSTSPPPTWARRSAPLPLTVARGNGLRWPLKGTKLNALHADHLRAVEYVNRPASTTDPAELFTALLFHQTINYFWR